MVYSGAFFILLIVGYVVCVETIFDWHGVLNIVVNACKTANF